MIECYLSHSLRLSGHFRQKMSSKRGAKIQKWKDHFMDVTFIETFLREGLNIDIGHYDLATDPEVNHRFKRRLRRSSILNMIGFLICIASWITWDMDVDPICFGNWLPGTMIPKEIVIITVGASFFMSSIILFTSYLVFIKNPNLEYTLRLIRVVSGPSRTVDPSSESIKRLYRLDRGIGKKVIHDLRNSMRPLIGFLHLIIRPFPPSDLIGPKIAGVVIPLTGFLVIDPYFMIWKLLFVLPWCIHLALSIDMLYWSTLAALLLVVIPCKFFLLTIRKLDQESAHLNKLQSIQDEPVERLTGRINI